MVTLTSKGSPKGSLKGFSFNYPKDFILISLLHHGGHIRKKAPDLDQISLRDLYDGMRASYQNADDYLYEANLLYRIRSYGHSLALATLGLEELGKSFSFFLLLFQRIGVFNSKKLEEDLDQLFEMIHRDHHAKQRGSIAFALANHLIFQEVMTIAEHFELENPQKAIQYMRQNKNQMKARIRSRAKHLKRWEKDKEHLKYIQNLKENGMYVGFNKNTLELNNPRKIKAKDTKKTIEILDRYIDDLYYLGYMTWAKGDEERVN